MKSNEFKILLIFSIILYLCRSLWNKYFISKIYVYNYLTSVYNLWLYILILVLYDKRIY